MLTPHKEDPNRTAELERAKKDPKYCIKTNADKVIRIAVTPAPQ